YTIEHVDPPLAPNGALVYLTPLLVNSFARQSKNYCLDISNDQGIANFGSKILGGVQKAAHRVAPTLHKVLSTISGPVGMIHPGIGGALGAGANLAGAVDRLKRSNSSGGMMSNDDAESVTVWMYDQNWYNSGDIVPDQVTPASDATPLSDGSVTAGISTEYSRGDHTHPLNVTTTIPPSDSASGSVGTTNYYARNDHSHPTNDQLLILLCANGDTTTLDNKLSRTFSGSGWVKLCVFPADASVGNPYIEFKLYSAYNAVQIIRLQPYYTVNGINTVYGIFIAPTRVISYYLIDNGANQLFHTHTGTGTSAIYSAYIRLETFSSITVVVTDQSTYFTNRITEILTQDVVTTVPTGTQIPITYDLGNGGIINNMIQVNPTGRTYSTYNNGCSTSAINTTQAGQWEISKTNDNALTINPSSLRQTDHSVGTKTINNVLKINPTSNDYTEGIRIARSSNGNCIGIYLGCNPNSTSGTMEGQWNIANAPDGQLLIGVNTQIGQPNQGLVISADGQTLTFKGSVIAGAGATNGASNGSVNYSAGNPILWGVNSVDTEDGFYSNGTNIW
ncbi:MAG: hypothetical protein EZS28_031022, partial [Streblomastix strix]